jgi:hypothetical protein
MLTITIPQTEEFNEATGEFIYSEERELHLEHSLVSISKWESKWCKAFLDVKEKTVEETIDYIKCMTLDENVDDRVYARLTRENFAKINEYIGAPMTATRFYTNEKGKKSNEQVTSELIYYWMIALNIPSEYQYWHLNRLLTLVGVCNVKNTPPKKMSKRDIASRNAQLNAARRAQMNTKG